jgi:hypothetical protein
MLSMPPTIDESGIHLHRCRVFSLQSICVTKVHRTRDRDASLTSTIPDSTKHGMVVSTESAKRWEVLRTADRAFHDFTAKEAVLTA